MKPIVYSMTMLMAFGLAGVLSAQEPPVPPPAPSVREDPIQGQVPVPPRANTSYRVQVAQQQDTFAVAQKEFERAKVEADFAKVEADAAQAAVEQETMDTTTGLPVLGQWRAAGPNAFFRTGKTEKALVVRTTEPDPKALASSEEDLNIMGRILEKALSPTGEEEQKEAMGIRLVTFGGHPSLRNLQIEGFGAIFFLNVNFPLAGPDSKTEINADKEPSNSTWDEAKREIYGSPDGTVSPAGTLKEDYDPKRVEKLKSALLEALKNASNMHSLKSDETVLVVVSSEEGGMGRGGKGMFQQRLTTVYRADTAGGGGGRGGSGTSGMVGKPMIVEKHLHGGNHADGSVLTIRAKKADIDAFASGKLNLEEFRNKVKVLVY